MIQLPRRDQPLIPLDGTLDHPILQSSARTQQRKTSLMKNIQQAVNGKKEKCYKCLEPWVPSHSRTFKFKNQLHLIAIEDNGEGETESDNNKPVETNVDEDTSPEL
jgi:hypothetical protein